MLSLLFHPTMVKPAGALRKPCKPSKDIQISFLAFSVRKTWLHPVKYSQNPTRFIQACSFNPRVCSYKEIVSHTVC